MIKLIDLLEADFNNKKLYIDKKGRKLKVIDSDYLVNDGFVRVQYLGSKDVVEYKGNFEADLKTGLIKPIDNNQ
jgi:hypothetical protein